MAVDVTVTAVWEVGAAMPAGLVMDETLADKLEALVVGNGCRVTGPMQFGAWARKVE